MGLRQSLLGPSAQVTLRFWGEQEPLDAAAEMNSTPLGSASVTVTPLAASGPWLSTPIV